LSDDLRTAREAQARRADRGDEQHEETLERFAALRREVSDLHESLGGLTEALAADRGDRGELLRLVGQLTREVARLSSTATAPLYDAPRTKPSYAHLRYSPYSSPRRGPSPPRSPILCTPTSPPTTRAAHRGGRPSAAAPRSEHCRCSPAQKTPVEDFSIFDYSVFDQQADAQVRPPQPAY
jgi:hypothetical protein